MKIYLKEMRTMTKQEILDRIWNVLNQGVDTESGDLDLLRHDLENDVIAEQKSNDFDGIIKEVMEKEHRRRTEDIMEQFNRECD